MSDREDRPFPERSDETVAFSGPSGPPPPGETQPMYVSDLPPPPRGRQALIFALIFLLGLGGGFALAQFFGQQDDSRVPDENLVLFESASTTFPIEGAQFTRSTYDTERRECSKELLKQLLRADSRRFEAWLDLQDITSDEFDRFVDRLETRILTAPTPFTNHGCFGEGDGPCPFAIQSVLGAGTPVWFDPVQRRIVAKCACSNPLKPPRCPPNCEDIPTPSPSPTPSPTGTPTTAPTPTPTRQPTPAPTRQPTQPPPTLPVLTESPTPPPTASP